MQKLSDVLLPPTSNNGDPVRRAAVDHIALKFLTLEDMKLNRPFSSANTRERAYDCLARQDWTPENLVRLCKQVDGLCVELRRSNDETRKFLAPAIGKPLIDGKPFKFEPDPFKESGIRLEDEARAEFARQLVLLYRWMGGDAKLHKYGTGDGAPTSEVFMKFLTAIAAAIPKEFRPKGNSLHRRAQSFLDEERHDLAA